MVFFYHITGRSGDSSESILGSLGITPKKFKMDWAYGAPEDATSKAGLPALGFYVGDRYRACNGALGTLKDITTRYVKILQKLFFGDFWNFWLKV